jgi:hypothetical protein
MMNSKIKVGLAVAVFCLMTTFAQAAKTQTARTHTETQHDRSPRVHVRGPHPRG